jgi:hypothetical protein
MDAQVHPYNIFHGLSPSCNVFFWLLNWPTDECAKVQTCPLFLNSEARYDRLRGSIGLAICLYTIEDPGPSEPGPDGSVVEHLVYIQEVLGSIPS